MLENILSGIICTAICAFARHIFLSAKEANSKTLVQAPKKPTPRKTLKKQFFVSLFLLVATSILAPAIPLAGFIAILKMLLYMTFAFSFILTWGAFEAAFVFYPSDQPVKEKPTKDATSETVAN